MKMLFFAIITVCLLTACRTYRPASGEQVAGLGYVPDTLITHSLFNDKASTISEEAIQKILGSTYQLPRQLRVAIVRIESINHLKKSYWYYWSDEQYLKTQQAYLDSFSVKLKQSSRVTKLSLIPGLLISSTPSFTNIREAAVRLQADAVVVYMITSDLYSKYKLFSKPDLKAYATTQLLLLDVKTGLVPFSAIVTRDVFSQKKKEDLDNAEAAARIQHEAVLLTINEVGQRCVDFLATN